SLRSVRLPSGPVRSASLAPYWIAAAGQSRLDWSLVPAVTASNLESGLVDGHRERLGGLGLRRRPALQPPGGGDPAGRAAGRAADRHAAAAGAATGAVVGRQPQH